MDGSATSPFSGVNICYLTAIDRDLLIPSFIRIEVVGTFERRENPRAIPIRGIQKIHSLLLRDKEVVALPFPCPVCMPGSICDDCQRHEGVRMAATASPSEEADGGADVDDDDDFTDDEGDNSDDGDDSAESYEEDDGDEDDDDNIVWAPFT